jgi:hypothetical protein
LSLGCASISAGVQNYTPSMRQEFIKPTMPYDEYPHSIATAFAVDQLDPDEKAMMLATCYFEPGNIPKESIRSSFDDGSAFSSIESELESVTGMRVGWWN